MAETLYDEIYDSEEYLNYASIWYDIEWDSKKYREDRGIYYLDITRLVRLEKFEMESKGFL